MKFSANRCLLLWLLFALPLLPCSLPTQDSSAEIKLCRQIPQGLPEDILFLGENEFIDFSASGEHEVRLSVQVSGVCTGAGGGPAPSGWAGGSSWHHQRLLVHPGRASRRGEGGLSLPHGGYVTCPLNEVQAPGYVTPGLVLWPKLYFSLCPHTVSITCLDCKRCSIHSHGKCEEELFSYSSILSLKGATTRGTMV